MSDKLTQALTQLEKARTTALEIAIAEARYRLCPVLDGEGQIQKGINRARRLLNGTTPKTTTKK